MTPSYIVISTDSDGALYDVEYGLTNQKKALELAEETTVKYGRPSYVYELLAKVELPVPQPIVTMKGD